MKKRKLDYYFPDESKPNSLKMFQERINQIRAFYFTRDNMEEVRKIKGSKNYAIYFLFNEIEEEKLVYIGQSTKGIDRVNEHKSKEFWSYCIMFITDNNTFDKNTIDYLEYRFINEFNEKSSQYTTINKDPRKNEPNISIYDKPNYESQFNTIKFLLMAEKITFEVVSNLDNRIYYKASGGINAKIYVANGEFVLVEGSEIMRPREITKSYKGRTNHYDKYTDIIENYIKSGKIEELSDGKIISKIDISFKNPSKIAYLCSGGSRNGWEFFKGLSNIRK